MPSEAPTSSSEGVRRLRTAALVLLVLPLAGCSGKLVADAVSSTTPTPTPSSRRLLLTSTFAPPVVPFGTVAVVQVPPSPVPIPSSGRVEVVLDWTFPDSNFDLFVSDPGCNANSLTAGTCNLLGSDRGFSKPAAASFDLAGGSITVFAVQLTGPQESGVVTVWLTPRQP